MIRCVPIKWAVAHICDKCGAVGPMVGELSKPVDEVELTGSLHCDRDGNCMAVRAGWDLLGDRDLCPVCKETK